jgi:hypothetical protein
LLDQAALQISREREASQPRTPLLLLPDLLRNALSGSVLIKAASAVHLAPVAHTDHLHHLHHQHLIEHLVNDAVIPYTHPVDPDFALKGNAAWWSGILCQQINGRTNALLITSLQILQGADSTAGQANLIAPSWLIRAHLTPGQDQP